MSRNFILTTHAIDRFLERVVNNITHKEAEFLLWDRLRSVSLLEEKTFSGQQRWKITQPDAIIITKTSMQEGIIVLTVLNPNDEIPEYLPGELERIVENHDLYKKVMELANKIQLEHRDCMNKIKRAEQIKT